MYKEKMIGVYVFPESTRLHITYVITSLRYDNISKKENFDLHKNILGPNFNNSNMFSWYNAKRMNPTYNKDWYK